MTMSTTTTPTTTTTSPLLSICIPNFNYERYLGETLTSVLAETSVPLEVLISDNASTDRSVAVAEGFHDPRVRVSVNAANVGFAGNLDRAGQMARGELMLMLSSDDLVRPGALALYAALVRALGPQRASRAVVTATCDVVDSFGRRSSDIGRNELWEGATVDEQLSQAPRVGVRVFRIDAPTLLRRSLVTCKNPFNFLATLYPRALWQRVEGYRGSRLINPDKWFHQRLLGVADEALFVDAPLFAYRWHAQNQTAQQKQQGALKFLVDEYATTLEVDDALLARAGLRRDEVVHAFVERVIVRHGLATLARGDRDKAKRILEFGRAVYPWVVARHPGAVALASLLLLRSTGAQLAKAARALLELREERRGERDDARDDRRDLEGRGERFGGGGAPDGGARGVRA